MKRSCGCSSCATAAVSSDITNRPGLSALAYRIGTYDSFFATMKARLSSTDFSLPPSPPPLLSLKTRDQDDPAIALLDAWAVLADILTFYQERIANEGYLRTATERQSIVALSALVGAALRPGVSASTYVAYTVDPTSDSTILAGSKVQSVPGPGELPQTFETSEDLSGSGVFSAMVPRLTRPQILSPGDPVYLSGMSNNVSPNDPLLLGGQALPLRVATVFVDAANNRTNITLQPSQQTVQPAAQQSSASIEAKAHAVSSSPTAPAAPTELEALGAITSLVPSLTKPPASHPVTALDLNRRAADVYQPTLDTAPKIVRALNPDAAEDLYPALAKAQVAVANPSQVFAFRVKAPVYGNNAPLKPIANAQGIVTGTEEWPLAGTISVLISLELNEKQSTEAMILKRREATDEGTGSFIKITEANTSAMAAFTSSDTSVQVGNWKVAIEGNLSEGEMTIKIPGLARDYAITFAAGGPYKVVADTSSLSALANQSASTNANGRRIVLTVKSSLVLSDDGPAPLTEDQLNVISLDSIYDKVVPGSTVYIARADNAAQSMTATVNSVASLSLNLYGIPARVTQLTLNTPWLNPETDLMLSVARNTTVYAQSELLPLSEEPITDLIQGDTIELGALYSDLQPGRWLVISGERADIDGVTGIQDAELVMLASVKQGVQQISVTPPSASSTGTPSTGTSAVSTGADGTSPPAAPTPAAPPSGTPPVAAPPTGTPISPTTQNRPGESTHSFLQLASPLAYTYKPNTVKVYGNVVQATQGETRKEVIGSGDSSQSFQQFTLHASPLTYTSAATQSGVASSLAVYVNGIQWKEVDSLTTCGPTDRNFVTSVDDQNAVTVTFGDGQHGMRLPTGVENVQATYRTGIGSGGNLDTGSLTLLSTKPLGARAVTNPVIASGGADRDSTEVGRRNAPLASIALDRLVSVSDYASFARTFAGIGKATSALLPVEQQRTVAVSITGAEGSELATDSLLVQQLTLAFQQLGDPHLPVDVLIADPLLLVISAKIKTLPDYPWTTVSPMVSAALLEQFSFDSQLPGASVYLSTVIGTIQQVPGVAYTVINGFDTISRSEVGSADAFSAKLAELSAQTTIPNSIPLQLEHIDARGNLQPSGIAYLSPDLPDTLLLTEITS